MKRIHLTGEPRGDHLTNRCIELRQEPCVLGLSGWRDDVELNIRYDGGHCMATHRRNDGFEFDLILTERPHDNEFAYKIKSKNLVFCKQPPLTPEEIADGHRRPDNVVGSYAVYHSNKRNNYRLSNGREENYQCGKFGHIYRPKAIDDNGKWAWCDMNIADGRLVIVAPQEFLDNAKYPVTIDPVIGYDEVGASTYYPDCYTRNDYSVIQINYPANHPDGGLVSQDQLLESISVYTWTSNNAGWPDREDRFKIGIYTRGELDYGLDDNFVAAVGSFTYATYNDPKWLTKSITGNLIAGTKYVVAFQAYSENCGFLQGRVRLAYDARPDGAPLSQWHDAGESWDWPSTFDWENNAPGQQMYSLYITYIDPPPGKMYLAKGWIVGNVELRDNSFQAELRGRAQHLQQNMLEVYTSGCRADLGDTRCGVDLEDSAGTYHHSGAVTSVSDDRLVFIDDSVSGITEDVFRFGLLTWSEPESADGWTGNNAGFQIEIKKYEPGTKEFTLFQPMPYAIGVGDEFEVTWGCDKSLETCRDRYDNLVNFRGEPHIPSKSEVVTVRETGAYRPIA